MTNHDGNGRNSYSVAPLFCEEQNLHSQIAGILKTEKKKICLQAL